MPVKPKEVEEVSFNQLFRNEFQSLSTEEQSSVAAYIIGVMESMFDYRGEKSISKENLHHWFEKAIAHSKRNRL
ncbi:hypothetical protein FZC76_15980 [Sutcliffiella horikoshii]|uniref:Uncharacterized protein n=1 Tax=Sutcliffiella horikoshii TaxID=79883 RepID=A0A5D4SYY4_9BACI|nr:hypothetical protein [Sutcliffiella horikoshii]TYS67026.1 hypothetical protein FZC76_15980 [Sutcliffiella horikoshii]